MKKSFLWTLLLSFFLIDSSFAAGVSEEDACFTILADKVNSIYGVDLSNVYNGFSNIDISTYSNFRSERQQRVPGSYIFESQRNNIGTVVLPINYIATQYVPFGNLTNFKFPIDNDGTFIGDTFTNFRNQLVYTHHNIYDSGSFLSCGYLKITPYAGFGYFDLDPSNYFTNILDGGGFEINDSVGVYLSSLGNTGSYIIGKSIVQGAKKVVSGGNVTLDKLFKIDIVNVIYDNQSSYFNEYETFPLQVDTMTDADAYTTAWSLQQDFISRVMNQTCLSSVHPDSSSLPGVCAGSFVSLSSDVKSTRGFASLHSQDGESLFNRLFSSFLIPQANAALSAEDLKEVQSRVDMTHNGTGFAVQMDENFDYFQYKKILSFPSERLREYTLLATSSTYESGLQMRVASGMVLSDYDATLLGCGFSYSDRVKLLKDWINSIDIASFSLENIEYPDPKLGDCVIPFPDKRHKDVYITGSFVTNQKYAQYLISQKSEVPIDSGIQLLENQLRELEAAYTLKINEANAIMDKGDIVTGKRLLLEASKEFEPKIDEIQNKIRKLLNPHGTPVEKPFPLIPLLSICVGVILCLIAIILYRKINSDSSEKVKIVKKSKIQ